MFDSNSNCNMSSGNAGAMPGLLPARTVSEAHRMKRKVLTVGMDPKAIAILNKMTRPHEVLVDGRIVNFPYGCGDFEGNMIFCTGIDFRAGQVVAK